MPAFFGRLNPRIAEMFTLRFFEGKDNPEIAKLMNTTPGTVAVTQAVVRDINVDCGCFGTTVQTQVGAPTLLRDLALGIPFYVLALRPARKLSVDARLGLPDRFASAAQT